MNELDKYYVSTGQLNNYYIKYIYPNYSSEIIHVVSSSNELEKEIDFHSRYTNYDWEVVTEEDYIDYMEYIDCRDYR